MEHYIEKAVNDPHVKERGVYIAQNHPEAGKIIVYCSPWTSYLAITNPPAQCLGEHNGYVFKKLLGMADTGVGQLVDEKLIY